MKLSKIEIYSIILTAVFIIAAFVCMLLCRDKGTVTVTSLSPPLQTREEQAEMININTASEKELCSLPGVGETIARRIIAYRGEHGDFKTLESLTMVEGIGSKTLEKLRPFICIN